MPGLPFGRQEGGPACKERRKEGGGAVEKRRVQFGQVILGIVSAAGKDLRRHPEDDRYPLTHLQLDVLMTFPTAAGHVNMKKKFLASCLRAKRVKLCNEHRTQGGKQR